ncbi:hypothetical protein JRQ81_011561 [Phrynocephalus forsythii]|uniref:G-protein coupled receptors family 1 profile domain-containing protein n=1 Tax=Phrynocephalus forsythii TaxID=171643 RepID=A0A9Q0X831_9SAUR|nr:hypothetical protein JRQ81_011561 [Phrynocephalus forsythii]
MAPKAAVLAVYIFAFVTGLPSNLLACYSFLRKVRQKPVPIDILLLNLTLSDLFFLLFLPFKMVEAALDHNWRLPYFLCPLVNFLFYSSIYLSTLFLMGVSVERYLCVAHPVKHKLNRRPTYARVASLIIWFLACSHCLSIVYVVEYLGAGKNLKGPSEAKSEYVCYGNFSAEQLQIALPFRLELCIVLFLIPFVVTSFCYISVIRILTTMPNIKPNKKQRAVGLALATLVNYAIVFAPYNISHIVGFVQNKDPEWREETFFLTSLNTTMDPVIFFFSSATIRQTFIGCWRRLRSSVGLLCFSCCFRAPKDNADASGAGQLSVLNTLDLAGSSTPIPYSKSTISEL